MSNYSWRRFRLQVLEFVERAKRCEITENLRIELVRIEQLVEFGDEIENYPKVFKEAPSIASLELPGELVNKYKELVLASERLNI